MDAFSDEVYSSILNCTVKYERFKMLSERLDQVYRLAADYQQSEGMMIAGPSGVGKSRIVERFCEKYPDERRDEYMFRPIIRISMPSQPTPLALLHELNSAFGPQYASGSKSYELQTRFIDLAKKCRTNLVIIDEAQHMVRHNNQKTTSLAADTIKIIMDQCRVGVLLSGILRTEALLQANRQLLSRFTEIHIVDPWQVVRDIRGSKGVDIEIAELREFSSVVDALAASSGYQGDRSLFSDMGAMRRMYFATDGRIRYISRLVAAAMAIAIPEEAPKLEIEHLSRAFIRKIFQQARPESNPFSQDFVERRLNAKGEPFSGEDE